MVPLESLIKKKSITGVSEQSKNGENTTLCTRCSRDRANDKHILESLMNTTFTPSSQG